MVAASVSHELAESLALHGAVQRPEELSAKRALLFATSNRVKDATYKALGDLLNAVECPVLLPSLYALRNTR